MQTFDNLTITSPISRVKTAAVVHSFKIPEGKNEAYRGPERGIQTPKVIQQVKAEDEGFRPVPGHGDLWGLRRE